MLKDTVRTGSYRSAIVNNPHLFKGKNVLVVGGGEVCWVHSWALTMCAGLRREALVEYMASQNQQMEAISWDL